MDSFILIFCSFIGGVILTVVALALVRAGAEEEKLSYPTMEEKPVVKRKPGRPSKIKQDS